MESKNLDKIKKIELELEKYIENEEAFLKTKLFKELCLHTELVNYFGKFGIDLEEKDIRYIKLDEPLKYLETRYYPVGGYAESYYVLIKKFNLNLKITVSNFNGYSNDKFWSIYIHSIF